MLPLVASDQEAIDSISSRLQDDIGFLIKVSLENGVTPFWALARSMFPIAEFLAYLLDQTSETSTSKRLSTFIRDVLGQRNAGYVPLASIICQVWRHALTHTDVPPVVLVRSPLNPDNGSRAFSLDSRSMSWSLNIGAGNHLQITKHGDQSASFVFDLKAFYEDLVRVVLDVNLWATLPKDSVMHKYNGWSVVALDEKNGQEAAKATDELLQLLPPVPITPLT